MNLVFIGYRGTGKTAVSEEVARLLGRERVGMDAVLVERFGKSIPEFVAENGWDAFRDAEAALAAELGARDNLVIDCGGGVIVRESNVEALRANGRVVWLTASVETIARRIEGDTQRPSLTGAKSFIEEIEEVLRVRQPLYSKACDYSIDSDTLTIHEVVQAVLAWWRSQPLLA